MDELTFDDVLKMGWQKAYKLMHDIVEQDMEYKGKKRQHIIRKQQLIKKEINND